MWIWMAVTKDKYELPIAVAETALSLALKMGTKKNVVESVVSKWEHGKQKKTPYVRVWIEEDKDGSCNER